jgi:ABC-type glutathione transport system ATPase component
MNAGKIVERGSPRQVLFHPVDPYTRMLIASVPRGLAGRNRRPDSGLPAIDAAGARKSDRQASEPALEVDRLRNVTATLD